MTDSERQLATRLLHEIELAILADAGSKKEQFALISKMLLTYPVANASSQSGVARGEAYLDALDDIPPFAISEAIKRWNRGDAGDHDYRWAPAPGVLRQLCVKVLEPFHLAAADLTCLLSAVSLERAMDPKPLPYSINSSALRRMSA